MNRSFCLVGVESGSKQNAQSPASVLSKKWIDAYFESVVGSDPCRSNLDSSRPNLAGAVVEVWPQVYTEYSTAISPQIKQR